VGGAAPAIAERDPGASESILIVELGGWRCGALPAQLAKAGYQARVVQGVPAALDISAQEPISLCIVGGDIDFAACHTLRQALSAPVLALLTYSTEEQTLAILDAGADDCQASTISHEELVARIRTILRHHAAGSAPRP